MAGIKDYSPVPASNTDLFPEGMAPSAVNDGMRQVQADIRAWYDDAEWIDPGYAISYAGATSFAVGGVDVTDEYHVGRRVKAVGTLTGTIYGTISSSSFSTNTTVDVTWDSGSLQSEALTVALGVLRADNRSHPIMGTAQLAEDAVFPSGTRMLFQQTSAPTGWTKETNSAFNNAALRLVTGTASSGGASAFTSVFGSGKSTGAHTLTVAEVPAHRHFVAKSNEGTSTDVSSATRLAYRWGTGSQGFHYHLKQPSPDAEADVGLSSSVGSNSAHDHSLSLDLKYRDVIIATKN